MFSSLLSEKFTRNLRKNPYKFQDEGVQFALAHHYCIIGDQMGLGKAQPLDSILMSPHGPIRMGDIRVGDKILGKSGTPISITGVFPQGKKKVYICTFTDGSSVKTCGEHLWSIQSPNDRFTSGKFRIKELKEFKEDLKLKSGNRKWFIPICDPVNFTPKKIYFSGYVLGVLIGDGSLKSHCISFTKQDLDLVEEFKRELPSEIFLTTSPAKNTFIHRLTGKNNLNHSIARLEIERLKLNVGSIDKYIPPEYLYNSIEVRYALLQGLMDTDGYVSKDGRASQFSTSSPQLAEDFLFLVRSLGGVGYLSKKDIWNGTISHTITINLPSQFKPFRLYRKSERFTPPEKYLPYRAFDKVEYIGEEECQCISVDAPDRLYLTDDFIVTHNTMQSILLREIVDLPTIVVCPGYLRDTWKREFEEAFFLPPQIYVCYDKTDCDYMNKILWVEQSRSVNLNVIIISYDLIQHAHYIFSWARMYIADEVHYLKNINAKRTKIFHSYLQGFAPERFVGLSGTSIKNKAVEWYSPLLMCSYNPKKTSGIPIQYQYRSIASFGEDFGKRKVKKFGGRQIIDYVGVKNVPKLLELLKDKYIRRKVEDVIELPPTVEKEVFCTHKMDDELLKKIWAQSGGYSAEYLSKIKCDSAYAKADFTASHIESILENDMGPVVCFSDHIKPVDYISEELSRKGYKVATIKGEVQVDKRADIVARFQAGAFDVLVATIGSASTGYTLTKSNQMVFNDIPWGPADLWQAQKRIMRIGQSRTCFIHYILGSMIDNIILKTIKSKIETLEKAL